MALGRMFNRCKFKIFYIFSDIKHCQARTVNKRPSRDIVSQTDYLYCKLQQSVLLKVQLSDEFNLMHGPGFIPFLILLFYYHMNKFQVNSRKTKLNICIYIAVLSNCLLTYLSGYMSVELIQGKGRNGHGKGRKGRTALFQDRSFRSV